MMTREQAAKYMIVGWIKGWSLHFYWLTVMESKIGSNSSPETAISEAHNAFPWLPSDPFMFINKVTCQRYIGDHMPALNDALFNCDDNMERLKLFHHVLAHDGNGCKRKTSRKFQRERTKLKRDAKADKISHQINQMSIAEMRRGSGHAWGVCK